MSIDTDFAKLNRLRVNAGKPELKSWKGSKAALAGAITKLEEAGHVDVLPGAKVDIAPVADDPELAKTQEPVELKDSAMAKNIANEDKPKEPEKKSAAKLARGLETDTMARNSRFAVQMQREREKKEEKAARAAKKDEEKKSGIKLSKKDKKQIKDEAASRKAGSLPKGQVDPKKDPEKAKRQQKHIEDKQAKRKAAGGGKKEASGDTVTVADIARELDIDPKVARAKMRRYEDKPNYPKTIKGERWTFPKAAAADIKKILQGSK